MCKSLIFEELSISDDIIENGNRLINDILDKLSITDGNVIYINHLFNVIRKDISIIIDKPLFGNVERVNVTVYFVKNKKDVVENYQYLDFGGEFLIDEKTISITTYGINEDINLESLRGLLFHELKHAYQESLYNSSELPKILSIATDIISHPRIYKNTTVNGSNAIYDISRLIYYFSKTEIDANMESLYQELTTSNNDIKGFMSQTIYDFELHKAMFNEYQIYIEDDDVCNELEKIYDKTFSQLMNYIKNGIKYFEAKKRKVFAKYLGNKIKTECMNRKFRNLLFIR